MVALRQVLNRDLGCASYVIADPQAGVAAVVDPKVDIEDYLELERELGVRITDVVETHNHADHVSGRPALAELRAPVVHIHRLAEPEYAHRAFDDGAVLQVGEATLQIVHTPGHRPEHCAILVGRQGARPTAVLTGDSLFVGDVARPDLAVDAREGARELYRSLRRLAALDGSVEVYPAHIGGSLCGTARMSSDTSSTIGRELQTNLMFRTADEEAFVDALTSGLAPQPPNFRRIVARNRSAGPAPAMRPAPVTPESVPSLVAAGVVVIDGRAPEEFDAAHIPGSLNVLASSSGFGTRAAWMVRPDAELLLVAGDELTARRMAAQLAAVAVDGSTVLSGGFDAYRAAGLPLESRAAAGVQRLAELRAAGEVQVVDVREASEWETGHIPGSLNIPYHDLPAALDRVDPGVPVACVCAGTTRSALAASVLQRAGRDVLRVEGGMEAWTAQGLETTNGAAQ